MSSAPPADPAFPQMALDILASVLGRADNPGAAAAWLCEEIQELTGARCVALVLAPELPSGPQGRVLSLLPERRRGWTSTPAAARIFDLAVALPGPALWRGDQRDEAGELLRGEGFGLSLAVPLRVGALPVGALLALDDPDAPHAPSVLALLSQLAPVVALVLRHAALFERQEQAIAERTRELREAAEATRASRDRLKLALAENHYVWELDLVAGRLVAEEGWDLWHGAARPVLEGGLAAIARLLVHPDDLAAVDARLQAHLRGDTPVFESEHRTPPREDGAYRWVMMRGRVDRRDPGGRALHLTGVTFDATERRRTQVQLERAERMASLGTLAAGVAHEINNPLTFIIANLRYVEELLAERGVRDEEVAAALSDAQDGAVRVREVVSGLRAFSRPAAADGAPVDVAAELQAAVRLAGHEIRHRAQLDLDLAALPLVRAGGHQLGQVFLNLLVNAAQAIPPGRASQHRIRVSARTDPDGWALVEISDTGVGIPPQVLDRLFQPFFTTKPLGVGTGLGLSICHAIVTAAGGTIEVESAVGRGSTFRVRLPRADPAATAQPPEPPRPTLRRGRVLVLDDEPLVARAAARLLSRHHEVEVETSGARALERFAAGEAFDAVLCDLSMPDLTGIECYRRVARTRPELAARFVFATGGAFTEEAQDFLASAGRPWVEKPFDAEQLRRALAGVLGPPPPASPG